MNKRRTWIIILIALLLAGGGGTLAYKHYVAPADESSEPVQQTATVTVGDIVITVGGSGELVPAAELDLAFRTSGVLEQVLVEVGDKVQEGDELARLETDELERAIANADVEVQLAQLDLAEVRDGATDAELADARAALQDARVELQLAQSAYEDAVDSEPSALVERRRDVYHWYVSYYQEQKSKYEAGDLSQGDHDHAMNAMISAEGEYQDALNDELAQQAQAKNRLDQARNAVTQASENLELLESEPTTSTLTRAELDVDESLLKREKARLALEAAVLYAPFDGTVMEIAALVGEQVNTKTSILTLADLEEPLVQFWVEETELSHVAVGSPVNIVFEGLPDDSFTGEVFRVDPVLVTVDNTPAVQAWARLDLDSRQVDLFSGMTADVEVIAGETRNAPLVPVEALREMAPGQYAVFVLRPDGELEMRAVEVGLQDPVNAETLTGLEQGEIVSIGGG
jgi:HlyD family secretion protein